MSDDYGLNRNEEFFSGDIDFNDNFDMDPVSNKTFVPVPGTGLLTGVTDGTTGTLDGIIRDYKYALPNPFQINKNQSTFINKKINDLRLEFAIKKSESVRSLQNIAKQISAKITDKNSTLFKKLNTVTEQDFSSWENPEGEGNTNTEEHITLPESALENDLQANVLNNVADGLVQMHAAVGGETVAAIKTSNRELIGVQAAIKDLLDYKRNVQFAMDKTKVELLTRTYLVNVKFYKFMESAFQTSIEKFERIAANTKLTDFQKSSLLGRIKANASNQFFNSLTDSISGRVGGDGGFSSENLVGKIQGGRINALLDNVLKSLADNKTLIYSTIGSAAFANPRSAKTIGVGLGLSGAYAGFGYVARGSEPNDDENILDETGTVLLHAAKLREGVYTDITSKQPLKSWKDIKGAVYDNEDDTYITFAQLTGKIYGQDGRLLIIKGLDPTRDKLNSVWNKIDLTRNFTKVLDKSKAMFYQQDIYVRGDKTPRLTKKGFVDNKYYCLDAATNTPYLITGWNQIEGPVYELDEEGNLNQLISEPDIANGLVTSSGISLDKLTKMTSWLGVKAFKGLSKKKVVGGNEAETAAERVSPSKTQYAFSAEGIEVRLDKIYDLLAKRFHLNTTDFVRDRHASPLNPETLAEQSSSPISDVIEKYTNRNKPQHDPIKPDESERVFPKKIRLNSLADKKRQQEEKRKERFYDDIHSIREDISGTKDPKDKEKKKGIFSKLTGLLTSSIGTLAKLFTNPLGIAGSIGIALGKVFFKSLFASSKRLVTLGSLLFKGVLGIASPVYKLLTWGFTGLMRAMRGSVVNEALGGRGKGKGKPARGKAPKTKPAKTSRISKGVGRYGKWIAGLGALGTAALYSGKSSASENAPNNINFEDRDNYQDPTQYYSNEEDSPVDKNGYSNVGDEYGYNGNGLLTAGATVGAEIGAHKLAGNIGNQITKKAAAKTAAQAGVETASKIGMAGASKAIGRGVGRFIPGVNLALAAYDGFQGFTDRDQLADVYHKTAFTGTEKFANAATEVLGLGGLVPMAVNGLADLTGIDALKQEGGMTKFIASGLNFWNKIPLLNTPLHVLSLFDDDNPNKAKTPQVKIRMVMYGLNDLDNPLAQSIFSAEQVLEKFVVFDKTRGYVTFDEKTPYKDLLGLFDSTKPNDVAVWFRDRFLKVYSVWQSAIRLVGFANMEEFDNSKEPKVIKICNQVKGAIGGLSPYPLDVVTNVSPETPLLSREKAEALINSYLKALRDSINKGGNTAGADGIIPMDNFIRTDTEVRAGKSDKEAGFFTKISDYVKEVGVGLDDSIYKPSADVVSIDISDLHKDQNTAIDEITLVRLAAYGNTDNDAIRVDTVLRLERHCEKFFLYQGGMGKFIGKTNDIYNLFKNSFRVNANWEKQWVTWFNNRFLPVLKVWFEQVFRLRNAPPYRTWKSLSDTNKFIIAQTILDIKVKTDDTTDLTSVWDITESPYPNMRSGSDASIVKTYIANLESKSAAAKLKTPEDELKKSTAMDMSNTASNLSLEEQQKIISDASGGIHVGNYNSAPNTPSTLASYNNQSIGNSASETGVFSSDSAGDIEGGIGDYKPSATQTEKGFKISEKEAIKTILNEFVKAGITDNRVLAFALANAKAETDFQGSAESLNYAAERLPGIFSSTFGQKPDLAYKFGRTSNKPADQKAIANIAYGRRGGNQGGEDGWEYRGRGYTQLTFKDNYKAVGNAIGDPSIVNNPEKLTTDPVAAAKSAAGFFKANPEIIEYAKNGRIAAAAEKVGKHREGINKKVSYYPDFLKRLISGDLKGILSNEENKAERENSDENSTPQYAPIPPTPALGTAEDAVEKVNAPPTVEAITQTTPDLTQASAPDVPTAPAPAPVVNEPAPPAPAPVQPPVQQAPVSKPVQPPVQQAPAVVPPSEVKFPEGVIQVRDDAVASALVALADAIGKANANTNTSGKRVGLGQRI